MTQEGWRRQFKNPISQISESDSVDPRINGSEVVVEENTCPIIDNETLIKMVDNGGVVSMLENCDLYMEHG